MLLFSCEVHEPYSEHTKPMSPPYLRYCLTRGRLTARGRGGLREQIHLYKEEHSTTDIVYNSQILVLWLFLNSLQTMHPLIVCTRDRQLLPPHRDMPLYLILIPESPFWGT